MELELVVLLSTTKGQIELDTPHWAILLTRQKASFLILIPVAFKMNLPTSINDKHAQKSRFHFCCHATILNKYPYL